MSRSLNSENHDCGGADQINLLLHSPGGDGTIVAKMVDMCRDHLTGKNRKLRVIVANIAKTAATVLALGADQILLQRGMLCAIAERRYRRGIFSGG